MFKLSYIKIFATIILISALAYWFDLAKGIEIYISALVAAFGFYFIEHIKNQLDEQKNKIPKKGLNA